MRRRGPGSFTRNACRPLPRPAAARSSWTAVCAPFGRPPRRRRQVPAGNRPLGAAAVHCAQPSTKPEVARSRFPINGSRNALAPVTTRQSRAHGDALPDVGEQLAVFHTRRAKRPGLRPSAGVARDIVEERSAVAIDERLGRLPFGENHGMRRQLDMEIIEAEDIECRTMLAPLARCRAGTRTPSIQSACSGDTMRSRAGTPLPSAPARMRIGVTFGLAAANAPA